MKNNMVKSEDLHIMPSTYPSEGAKRYLPEVRISFHTEDKCYQATGRKLERGEVQDPTYQVLSVTTTKMLNSPAGGFSISLAGDQWEERLQSNDLVVIRMGYIGEATINTVMIGLIDRVRSKRSAQGGRPSVQTSVVGRDFGKMLLKSQLKFYPEIGANNKSAEKYFLTEQGWINMLGIFTEKTFIEGTPNVILEKIMGTVLPKLNDTQWTVYDETKKIPTPKKIKATNIMGWQFEATDFFIPFYLTADTFEGSIWNLMERATQKPFTELFIDTTDSFGSKPETKNVTKAPVVTNEKKPTVQATQKVDDTAKDTYYTVKKGDTLWAIAGVQYKDNMQWRDIWDANKSLLIERDKRNESNPGHWIYPGQKLRIPGVKDTSVVSGAKTAVAPTAPAPTPVTSKAYPKNTQEFGYDNGKVMVTYRMTPFDTANWNSLPTHTLEAVDVIEEDLGRSDDDHYNVFWAGSTINPLGDMNIRMVSPPVMNIEDVGRYGISPLEVEIEGLAIDRAKEEAHKVALENLSNKYSKMLQTWYQDNHKYYDGTILCRGYGGYRVGQRLDYAPKGMEAYIEGVTQSFNVFTDWTTSLNITRGVKKKDKKPMKAQSTTMDKSSEVKQIVDKTVPKKETPPTQASSSKASATDKYYTVVKGDTLWGIASKQYGKGTDWGKLWDANKSMLIERDKRNENDPGHWIYPGQKLRVPQ